MRRREIAAGLIGAAVAGGAVWLVMAPSPPKARTPVIGFLSVMGRDSEHILPNFRKGLAQEGYIDGQNVIIEARYTDRDDRRFPGFARELVDMGVDVIAAEFNEAARAAKAATTRIPIVFFTGGDPAAAKLVASYNKPGANVTGITMWPQTASGANWLEDKRLELLDEVIPKSTTIGRLVRTRDRAFVEKQDSGASQSLGREIVYIAADSDREIEAAFEEFANRRVGGFLVQFTPFFSIRNGLITRLAAKFRLPSIYPSRFFIDAGGIASYGVDLAAVHVQFGGYVAKVLKGANPSELPVASATKIDFIVNLKAARAQNIAIPEKLLSRADEVIE